VSQVRVVVELGEVGLDALSTETAVRQVHGWLRKGGAAVVSFADAVAICEGGLVGGADLMLAGDRWVARALRRHGGVLAQGTSPQAFVESLLAWIEAQAIEATTVADAGWRRDRKRWALAVIGPRTDKTALFAERIRERHPALPLPLTYSLGVGEEVPLEVVQECLAGGVRMTVMVGGEEKPPLDQAQKLARETRQLVVAMARPRRGWLGASFRSRTPLLRRIRQCLWVGYWL
jgi:hypothetical protein